MSRKTGQALAKKGRRKGPLRLAREGTLGHGKLEKDIVQNERKQESIITRKI